MTHFWSLEKLFEPGSQISMWADVLISRSSAKQRAGRCGRIPGTYGTCFHIFSKYTFNEVKKIGLQILIFLFFEKIIDFAPKKYLRKNLSIWGYDRRTATWAFANADSRTMSVSQTFSWFLFNLRILISGARSAL